MNLPVYNFDSATPLQDDEAYDFLWSKIAKAHRRIWASVFIVNMSTASDDELRIRDLLKHLAYAKWRNVDVKVLVGQSTVGAIQVQTGTAAAYLQSMGIEARSFRSDEDISTHSKYLVIDDDLIVVGSNNWSPGGLVKNTEDALAIKSADLNTALALNFLKHWETSQKRGAL
ncbi:MAG: phospholipase D-like domain-containing protein [Myxococcota bacterium]|nr:phospholipase D-like domain-containing protein [Myxococcota bacterium]